MKISIAMAIFNGEQFLERQMETLLCQTQLPDEVILSDDCSTDNSRRVVLDFIKRHNLEDNWRLITNEKNRGYAINFWSAIDTCSGDIVYLCDQDDVWDSRKIEVMTKVFENQSEVKLLACKYAVVDKNEKKIRGLLVPKERNSYSLSPVNVQSILRAYRWPGMALAFRKAHFEKKLECAANLTIPHDLLLVLFAADDESFAEIDYVGVSHRRHNRNAAREEHRIKELLKMSRKLRDIEDYNNQLKAVLKADFDFTDRTWDLLRGRLKLSEDRLRVINQRSFRRLINLYFGEEREQLRLASFISDAWLILFGNYNEIRELKNESSDNGGI